MRCVPALDFNLAKAMSWRSAIADDPPYQRESSVWSLAKQRLFIDSLINGYDVPKIYLHDLRGKHPTKVYAVVDGKQRLSTIWRYMTDQFGLAPDFGIEPANLPDLPGGVRHPTAGDRFSDLDPAWQQVLRATHLAVVLIQNATEEDIEDLFSRLNNGEPLNAAEKRNAVAGDATRLVRQLARHELFASRVRFSNTRYQHHDAAARVLLIESAWIDGATSPPDLRSGSLDRFVQNGRRLPLGRRRELADRAAGQLDRMCEVFEPHDPLLATQGVVPLYYALVRSVEAPPRGWGRSLRGFLDAVQRERVAQLDVVEEQQDPDLRELGQLARAGTNEPSNLLRRLEILWARLHAERPELRISSPWLPDAPMGRAAEAVGAGTLDHG